jgi:hypothetical protein
MPNQHSPDKAVLSFYISRALKLRLQRLAEKNGTTLSQLIVAILSVETEDIELTAEDYEQIAKEVRAAKAKMGKRLK